MEEKLLTVKKVYRNINLFEVGPPLPKEDKKKY